MEAFRYMMTYVLESFSYGGDPHDKKTKSKKWKYTPFLFDSTSRNAESSFEVYFMDTEEHGFKSYNYEFTLNQDGVIEEWLNSKAKTAREYKQVFYRNGDELDLSGLPAKSQELIQISLISRLLILLLLDLMSRL